MDQVYRVHSKSYTKYKLILTGKYFPVAGNYLCKNIAMLSKLLNVFSKKCLQAQIFFKIELRRINVHI